MKSRLFDIFRDIIIYGAGDIILKATAFITLPIYTRIFTTEDYGILSFIGTSVGLISSLLVLGGDSAYARYYFEARTLEEKQVITSTTIIFLSVWSILFVLLTLPFVDNFAQWGLGNKDYSILFLLSIVAAPINLINALCNQVLRNQFKAQEYSILNVISSLLTIALGLVAVLYLKLGLVGLLSANLLGISIMLPIRLWTIKHFLKPIISLKILQKLLGYGIPLVPSSLAYWIFLSSDRLILGKLSTLDQL